MIDEPRTGTPLLKSDPLYRNGTNGTDALSVSRHALNGYGVQPERSVQAVPPVLALFCFEPPSSGVADRVEPLLAGLIGRGISVHLFVQRAFSLATQGVTIHVLGECRELDQIEQVQEFGQRAAHAFLGLFRSSTAPITLMGCDWSAVPALTLLHSKTNLDILLCLHSLERQRSDTTTEVSKQIEEIELSGLRAARGILAWEPAVAECARDVWPVCGERILDIPLLFPVKDFHSGIDPAAVKARYHVGPIDPTILYIGDLDERYGPDLLVKAMPAVLKRHPQARMVVVGYGELYWPLRIYSRYLLLDHAVRFPGSVEGTALYELIQAADLIAVPSRQSTPDWPVLAAWAAHRPVMATHEAASPILVHDENCVLVRPTVESCALGINSILNDPERARTLADNGHAPLARRFDWNGLATQLHDWMARRWDITRRALPNGLVTLSSSETTTSPTCQVHQQPSKVILQMAEGPESESAAQPIDPCQGRPSSIGPAQAMGVPTREFFVRVRKTIIPRPVVQEKVPVLGQRGSVRAAAATIYGSNWYHDEAQDLIEIWEAGPALCFAEVLPPKDLYAREGLYLQLALAYRTTTNAYVNIRTFSGNHVTLPNATEGGMYQDPSTRFWVTDDRTININSIHRDERLWLQRVDWEWVSQETIYEDALGRADLYATRTRAEIEALYAKTAIDGETLKELVFDRIRKDEVFARRCLLLVFEERLLGEELVKLYEKLNGA